ncbi:homoserine O-succinyltransferase [Rhodovibrionaceae bacterium A322]
MPIKVPDDLPARSTLEDEGVLLIGEKVAQRQDVRPLEIALLNLMPEKIKTERQISRLLGTTPLQLELTLLTTSSYAPKNTSAEHMMAFYQPWEAVKDRKFDGLIVTGAPIETLPFEEVVYWPELTDIYNWSQSNVQETYSICWGAQAALHHFYGIPKYQLPQKMFGIYPHRVLAGRNGPLRGFDDVVTMPVSRHTEIRREDLPANENLRVLLESEEAGLCLLRDKSLRQTFMLNHLEYETQTLADEYFRDKEAGADIQLPANYFPSNDDSQAPVNSWRAHGNLLFSNWIYDLYQSTTYDLNSIPALQEG